MTLLTMMQDVADEVGLPRPSQVVASTRTDIRQLLGLAQREGRELARRYPWQALVREFTHTTVATESQGALTTIMPGLDWALSQTFWNRSQQDLARGSISPQDWQWQKSSVTSSPFEDFRFRDGNLIMIPAPTAGETFAGEYVSKYFCATSGGTDQTAWAADTDVGNLDEDLMSQGIIWRWRRAKGHEWMSYRDDYEMNVKDMAAKDKPSETKFLDMPPVIVDGRLGSVVAPSGSWSP